MKKINGKNIIVASNNYDIKRCPFCGGIPIVNRKSIGQNFFKWNDSWEVKCSNCGTTRSSRHYETKIIRNNDGDICIISDGMKMAIDEWNERYEEDCMDDI